REQCGERLDGSILGRAVEVDEHVATKNEVVAPRGEHGPDLQKIAASQEHLPPHAVVQAMQAFGAFEMSRAKLEVPAPKGILSVHPAGCPGQGALADIEGVNLETLRRKAAVEKRHRHRVRLFPRRAR